MSPTDLLDSLSQRLRRGRNWRADWIWDDVAGSQDNRFVLFRRRLQVENRHELHLHLSADSRYRVWINGTFLGRGPVQSQPYHQFYDSYPIEPDASGVIDLAIEVYYPASCHRPKVH